MTVPTDKRHYIIYYNRKFGVFQYENAKKKARSRKNCSLQ